MGISSEENVARIGLDDLQAGIFHLAMGKRPGDARREKEWCVRRNSLATLGAQQVKEGVISG